MLRTRKEWYDYCIKRGTSGDQVFDILSDWQEEEQARNESNSNENLDDVSESQIEMFTGILKLSADEPEQLRSIDIDRVLDTADDMNCEPEFVRWLLKQNLMPRTKQALLEVDHD